jgi:transposase
MSQFHKRFSSNQLKELFERYLRNEIEREYIQEILGVKKSRFFMLLKEYRENPQHFTIQYHRTMPPRSISAEIEHNILKELSIEKKIIENKETPLTSYNYSYIRDRLQGEYRQKVSLPTIIDRAKRHGFYLKKPKRTIHDREVLTHYVCGRIDPT